MPLQLQDLPDELLTTILSYLLKLDLKEARLTCVRWSNIGVEGLFQRVYFAPRKDVMQRFADVTGHPIFSRTIKEVVYDGTLFQSRLINEQTFRKHYEDFVQLPEDDRQALGIATSGTSRKLRNFVAMVSSMFPKFWRTHEELQATRTAASIGDQDRNQDMLREFGKYKDFLAEQEEILSDGRDYNILCAGLRRMPQVTRVSLLYRFDFPDYIPRSETSHDWYQEQWLSICTPVVWPLPWDDRSNIYLNDTPEDRDWDCRGIRHFFQAVSKHCNSVKELQIGSSAAKAPLTMFHPSWANTYFLRPIIQNLTSLEIFCSDDQRADPEMTYQKVANLTDILLDSSRLEVFSMSLRTWFMEWIDVIRRPLRPNLKILDLGNLYVSPLDLLAVIQGSQLTLKEFRLRTIWLDSEKSWSVLADKLGQHLQLHCVTLVDLKQDQELALPEHRQMGWEDMIDLANRIMAWADPRMLEVGSKDNQFNPLVVRVNQEALLLKT